MSSKRASVFESDEPADLDLTGFAPQPPAADAMPAEQVRAVAEASKFPSREAKPVKAPAPAVAPIAKATAVKPAQRRQYRTGRSLAINVRAHEGTYTDFYAIVDGKMDGKSRPAADVMEMAVAALKRELAGQS